MEVRLKVLHPANNSVALLNMATRRLSNTTLDQAHHLLVNMDSMAPHLQDLLVNMVHPPGRLQDSISHRVVTVDIRKLQVHQRRPVLATFLARWRTSTCLTQRIDSAKP